MSRFRLFRYSAIALAVCSANVHAENNNFIYQDRIEITSSIPEYQESLSKVLPQQQVLDETSFSGDSLATLLSQAPAVNLNGQGGLLQSINIRGFSRWRIQTLVEGIPIYTERRAGTAVEFLPPAFIGQAWLTQGAASTQLGSGAIGGGLDLSVVIPEQTQIRLGYGDNQDYRNVLAQGKASLASGDNINWQFNHRHANNSSDGDGNTIQDAFEQQSLALRYASIDGMIKESFLLHSNANNVAKASADLPQDRFTLYPNNNHTLGKLLFDWHNAAIYFHDAKLTTRITRPGRRENYLQNDSFDWGLQLNDEFQFDEIKVHWRTGIDARTDVKARERENDVDGLKVFSRVNLDAEQWEAFVAADSSLALKNGTLVGGSRLAWQYQRDEVSDTSEDESNLSAFVGYAHRLNSEWLLSAYVSNAYRVPSLTERYFNGSTPRGTTLGDANLKTETALNIETSLSWQTDNASGSVSIFRQDIDDYIERLTINDELRQYRNLDSARVQGINYQFEYQFEGPLPGFRDSPWKALNWGALNWKLSAGGQWLEGEDQAGNPVADIPPHQHRISLSAENDTFQGFIAITHRQASHDIVPGELTTEKVTTLDAGYTKQINSSTEISVNITNLTDQHYVTSRDDLAPFARGRDVHLSVGISF